MIVYGKEILEAFVKKHAIAKNAVDRWVQIIEKSTFKGIDRITTEIEFDILKSKIDVLINEATDNGYLATQGANNIYTREIARLAKIGARYEDEFLHLSVGKRSRIETVQYA